MVKAIDEKCFVPLHRLFCVYCAREILATTQFDKTVIEIQVFFSVCLVFVFCFLEGSVCFPFVIFMLESLKFVCVCVVVCVIYL